MERLSKIGNLKTIEKACKLKPRHGRNTQSLTFSVLSLQLFFPLKLKMKCHRYDQLCVFTKLLKNLTTNAYMNFGRVMNNLTTKLT